MGRFPQSFIDDLKTQADIVQVIQDTVPLKKAGSSYKGLCPFHTEKTPSFHVNRDKGFFHCFGCSAGGDVVKFMSCTRKSVSQKQSGYSLSGLASRCPFLTTSNEMLRRMQRARRYSRSMN